LPQKYLINCSIHSFRKRFHETCFWYL